MTLQFNTDNNIHGKEKLEQFVSEKINHDLKYFLDKITRMEVHLSDQNAGKSGPDDIQCKIEARIAGIQPVTVVSKSDTKEIALGEAVDKMKAALSSIIGKMRDK